MQPILQTRRLDIRRLQVTDALSMFRVWGDPEVMRWIPGSPHPSVEVTRARLEGLLERARTGALVLRAVVRRDDGRVIGTAGVVPVDRKGPEVEVGYHFARDVWGQGYATEAAAACLAEGFRDLGIATIIGLVFPANVASARVLEKVGMRKIGPTSRFHGTELVLYQADAPGGEPVG